MVIDHLINQYKNIGIAKKALIILLFGTVIPILLITIIICMIAADTLKRQINTLVESNMKLSQNSLENYFSEYESIFMSIYTEDTYSSRIEKLNIWDSRNFFNVKKELEDDLSNISYLHPEILGIALVTQKRERILHDAITNSTMVSYCFPPKDPDWLNIVDETFLSTQTIYSPIINRRQQDNSERNIIYLGHRIADINNYREVTVGGMIICLDEESIRATYDQQDENKENILFLCDMNGNIISSNQTDLIGHNILDLSDNKTGHQLRLLESETKIDPVMKEYQMIKMKYYSIYLKPVLKNQFMLISMRDNRELLKDFKYIVKIIVILTVLMMIFIVLLMIHFANLLQNRVETITVAMDKAYHGNYAVQINHGWQDEFGKIARHFNHMVQKIDHSGKKEKEALLREKTAELKALEAQINPHFLYNTLDTINWIAIEKEQYLISKMLKNLATILRYSIHKSNSMVSVRSEIEYLKKYIYLQQQRFSFSFHCAINVEEGTWDLKLHKLLFQPLIENAIIHGFPGNNEPDKITISIAKQDDRHLIIQIEDNGRGMDSKLVEELNHYDYRIDSIEKSIGVRNVIMRIKYYYGEDGYFQISSSQLGTTVMVGILFEE